MAVLSSMSKLYNVLGGMGMGKQYNDSDIQKEATRLLQTELKEQIETRIGSERWVTVYQIGDDEACVPYFHSALIPNAKVTGCLESDDWDMKYEDGRPGCCRYYKPKEHTVYHRYGNNDGFEPLVIHQEFYGMFPNRLDLSEEFRLFHNLYHDGTSGRYLKYSRAHGDVEVALVDEGAVKVKLKELRQFLAIKEMHLAVYVDASVLSRSRLNELHLSAGVTRERNSKFHYTVTLNDTDDFSREGWRSCSRLHGKVVVPGVDKEKSGFWPYQEEDDDEQYEDFIIGIDNDGSPILHTCDPDILDNHFSANSGAPHYLTPVYFRRDVLTKYYNDTARFIVEDGYIRCGSLWGLRMDNNHPSHVTVFLGDLGRDLSYTEQKYWKAFNTEPQGGISSVAFSRGFMAIFADPEKADLLFKHKYEQFRREWSKKYSWLLFREPQPDDGHCLAALRIPLVNSWAEFDSQIISLVKVLIESLNDVELARHTTPPPAADAKSITKLEHFLAARMVPEYQQHIGLLRDLQKLRAGAGHRRGTEFRDLAYKYNLKESRVIDVFEQLLKRGIDLIDFLAVQLLSASSHDDTLSPHPEAP